MLFLPPPLKSFKKVGGVDLCVAAHWSGAPAIMTLNEKDKMAVE